ncbi:PucR family transcriptional regulator [Alkaliphilus hydrothermalis]|uniref:PucR family transcriptional regulator n=1 Tax=Alkaliphilus hydrothermalis TaxID=1482730 RepID=UPI00195A7AF4
MLIIKTLEELFKKIHKVYPDQLVLLKDNQFIISTYGEANKNQQRHHRMEEKFIYPIKSPAGEDYQVLAATELNKETLGFLELLINLYLEEIHSLDKKQILQYIATGHGKEVFLKSSHMNILKDQKSYQLIWIEAPLLEDEKELAEVLEECFKEDEGLTVVPTEEGIFILLEDKRQKEQLLGMAKTIRDMVNAELYLDVYIIISKEFNQLKKLPKILQGLKEVLLIGKTVTVRSHIYLEDELKLEKTIFSISKKEREGLYADIYENKGFEEMDEEAHLTIETFLKNNLNLGETSKALFIHRNTLAYRLDRISRLTGLDLRKFEDAIFFKIAMLLKKSI